MAPVTRHHVARVCIILLNVDLRCICQSTYKSYLIIWYSVEWIFLWSLGASVISWQWRGCYISQTLYNVLTLLICFCVMN